MFASTLKDLRERNCITQVKLAEVLGVAQQTVASWEKGKSSPNYDVLKKIADFFHVDTDRLLGHYHLLGDTDDPNHPWHDLPGVGQPLPPQKKIPIVATVKCGMGGVAFEDHEGYVYIDEDIHGDYIAFRCRGDSMIGEGIQDGDIAIVRLQDTAENGDIVVVIVDGEEGMLKRYYGDGNSISLISANPAYPPRVFTKENIKEVKIVGRVMETRRKR